MTDILPEATRDNTTEAERVMCDQTPISLSFLEAWVESTSNTSWWSCMYTGSGDNTPSLTRMPAAKKNITANLPEQAQFLAIYLWERTRTSRYRVILQHTAQEE